MENSSAIIHLPSAHRPADVDRCLSQWVERAREHDDRSLGQWMVEIGATLPITLSIFGNSPYLSRVLLHYPRVLYQFITQGADQTYAHILTSLTECSASSTTNDALMRNLRQAKSQTALLVALADITHQWTLFEVTKALSDLAQHCLGISIDMLLQRAHRQGEITLPHPESPSRGCGIIVLGMGKLGGVELNYSSDIDLILFFEPERLQYKGRATEQKFMSRFAHDLVSLMQERTMDGYVFRTDLRLRPDPASTPPMITVNAAYYYYESVGQNWERAAMIKARPVAGDQEAGERFLKGITPFMWRRSLDFATINDIHSIKRQMDSHQNKILQIKGHNVKLGLGGIREIEFYTQIHQLIWGGREPVLRTRSTCDTLQTLATFGLVSEETKNTLHHAYLYLRKLEHRLQMVADEQTHSLPETDEGLAHIACFMGYEDVTAFETELTHILHTVHQIYASSFTGTGAQKSQLGSTGNLVFTGTVHDPETLSTLRTMGFSNPETISEVIMGWHHGSRRATRTKRARELLTELMPRLLESLAKTAHPDDAFLKFHEFLSNLPAGVQLFSLFNANPHLLDLIADIMGSAPILAESLSKTPELLDAVLYEDFYEPLPSSAELVEQLEGMLTRLPPEEGTYFEEAMDRLRQFRSEKYFQAGVQLLRQMVTSHELGIFLSQLADILVQKTLDIVTFEFTKTYGTIAGSHFSIIGLGKLGSKEMAFRSDIDLIFVYEVSDFEALSDGEKSFSASVYYNRLAQRFLNALTAIGKHGKLYDVDTRLRPSGAQGLLAVSTKAITHYFNELAWTFEFMAFTKARIICAPQPLATFLTQFIATQISRPRNPEKLRTDVADMRERIAAEHSSTNPWEIKYVRGGLMDIDFIAQYLLLLHAPAHAPLSREKRPGNARDIFAWLVTQGYMTPPTAETLITAERLLSDIFHTIRLCSSDRFDEHSAPQGLKDLLAEAAHEKDFDALKKRLIQVEQSVCEHYSALLSISTRQPDSTEDL